MSYDGWVILTGALAAASCALLGCFLVLRRMSMMGDAISHAVLPGLAAAFMLSGSRASLPMFLGAAVVGVLTAVFSEWVHRYGRVDQSASMGVVFTSLFAIGLVWIVAAADDVDLDAGCVLYGSLELTPLVMVDLGWLQLPRATLILGCALIGNLAFVALLYKELLITTFDPALATTLGFDARRVQYLLMAMVAVTSVACFEATGSILVIAMLVVPPACAHLLTERLPTMLALAVLVGVVSAAVGHLAASAVPPLFSAQLGATISAGMIAVVAGLLFALTALFAPRHGVAARALARWRLSQRILREDVLGLLYRYEEVVGASKQLARATLLRLLRCGRLELRLALAELGRRGALLQVAGAPQLTDGGRDLARELVRSHRLWEAYLAKHLGMPADHLHSSADRVEHHARHLSDDLERALDRPSEDPHGQRIPSGRRPASKP